MNIYASWAASDAYKRRRMHYCDKEGEDNRTPRAQAEPKVSSGKGGGTMALGPIGFEIGGGDPTP